jgi:hypothetical protein
VTASASSHGTINVKTNKGPRIGADGIRVENGYNYPTARPQDATEDASPQAAIMSRFMYLRQIFAWAA